MDIQKENGLLEETFEVVADEMGFCLDQKWGDYENPYENSDTALAFNLFKKGWQAKHQAVPECKWIADENGIYDTGCRNKFVLNCDTPHKNGMFHCCYCGGKLIEAQEQSHD